MTRRSTTGREPDFTDGSTPASFDAPALSPMQTLERSIRRMKALDRLAKEPGLRPKERFKLLSFAHKQRWIVTRKLARIRKN